MTVQSLTPEIDVFNIPVFRDADIFPMIPADELAELADDIKENGLNEPVVVAQIHGEWMLIDGRNRREACRIAEVTPTYRIVEADADKLKSLVWSWNGPRRHLTSSQKAMAYAMMFPDGEKGGRGKKLLQNCNSLEMNSTDKSNISRARFILKHDSESAKLVRDGHPDYPLSKTYDAVKQAVEERAKKAEKERQELEKLTVLRGEYPDLAALVDEGRIYLHEALETAANRARKAQEEAERIAREADEQERRQREEEEKRLAEEERRELEQARLEQERFEANRAAFHSSLSQLISGSVIIQNPADCENPAKWKGTWTAFHNRYQIPIHEARERLKNLQARIPFILETLEAMRDE